MSEDRRILGGLIVLEKLKMAWADTPMARRQYSPEEMLGQFPMLESIKNRHGGLLSRGEQQLLALARAASAMPKQLARDVLNMSPEWQCSAVECC